MKVNIESIKVVYTQSQDDMTDTNLDFQTIEIESCDAGAGQYFVLRSERWAFNNIDELIKLLNNFKSKL